MALSTLLTLTILVLVGLAAYRAYLRYGGRRRAPRPMGTDRAEDSRPAQTAVPFAPPVPDNPDRVPEPLSRAFPVHGLSQSRDAATALEGALRRLAGIASVYVSPLTAFVYVDYFAAQVSEDQIVETIKSDGYTVGDAARRFDWRHVPRKS